jgi:hypothetical protein
MLHLLCPCRPTFSPHRVNVFVQFDWWRSFSLKQKCCYSVKESLVIRFIYMISLFHYFHIYTTFIRIDYATDNSLFESVAILSFFCDFCYMFLGWFVARMREMKNAVRFLLKCGRKRPQGRLRRIRWGKLKFGLKNSVYEVVAQC